MTDYTLNTVAQSISGGINELDSQSGSSDIYYLNGLGNLNLLVSNWDNVKDQIDNALGGFDNFYDAIESGKQIVDKIEMSDMSITIPWEQYFATTQTTSEHKAIIIYSYSPLSLRLNDTLLRNEITYCFLTLVLGKRLADNSIAVEGTIVPLTFITSTGTTTMDILNDYFYKFYIQVTSSASASTLGLYSYPISFPWSIDNKTVNLVSGLESNLNIYRFIEYDYDNYGNPLLTHYQLDTTADNPAVRKLLDQTQHISTIFLDNGEATFWSSQNEGTIEGTITQEEYNLLKSIVENHSQCIVIVSDQNRYNNSYQSVSCSKHLTGGEYSFIFLDYNNTTFDAFYKIFIAKSDLTCSITTKKINIS